MAHPKVGSRLSAFAIRQGKADIPDGEHPLDGGMLTFLARWLISLAIAFILFPVVFVLWNGPDADFGLAGGMTMMFVLQFISPNALWVIPLSLAALAALAWQGVSARIVMRKDHEKVQ